MAVHISNVPYGINNIVLAEELQPVLHGSPFKDIHDPTHASPMNFHVYMIQDKSMRTAHTGNGVLTFPSVELANLAVEYFTHVQPFSTRTNRIVFERSKLPAEENLMEGLQLMPYRDLQDPEPTDRLKDLRGSLVEVRNVQFIYQCRDWVLSPEWEWCPSSDSLEWPFVVTLEEATRELVVQRFDSIVSSSMIRMRYFSIRRIDLDRETFSFVMFLTHPPSYERDDHTSQPRKKLTALSDSHEAVAPFTWCIIRVICDSIESINTFKRMVKRVKIPITERRHEIIPRARYSPHCLRQLQDRLKMFRWEIAFPLEMMYREILLDPQEIGDLMRLVRLTFAKLKVHRTVNVLQRFRMKLKSISRESNAEINPWPGYFASLNEVVELRSSSTFQTGRSHFNCYHVTFTSSLMYLEGPFLEVSNRILRAYPRSQKYFLRASFTDEEGLEFRFDRKVDGSEFVARRVGGILKNGFTLCGRRFEFLSYSQSGLKEYTVWFVTPFLRGYTIVDSRYIRNKIGTRWSRELLRCPARYAARLSQAFTATEKGLIIEKDQIELIPDIERNNFCFTDGNGLVSVEMANAIYAGIKGQPTGHLRTPSVFQLRLQGAKGIITVDPTLDGLVLQLRPSMVKFDSNHSEVEIARSFEKPVRFFLNRPLTMILAGLGVPHSVFLKLQRVAVREVQEAVKSFQKAASLFETHGLGTSFSLSAIFQNFHKTGVTFEKGRDMFIDPLMDRSLQYAVRHVLRDLKTKGRIPVPGCWKLVGTVDVYNELAPNEIFVQIIRGPGAKPEYLQGPILMAKSPTIHPGDVQKVHAIGPPRSDSLLKHLANCVVFSQQGDRPLPNKLSGSDLDGDEYDLIPLRELHPPNIAKPGLYSAAPRKELDRKATILDIADFVVDYINNDVLGLVAINFLLFADTRTIFHSECLELAKLHSWAVDFPKNGKPVPFEKIPFPGTRIKPDWSAPEVNTSGHKDYYPSMSILGILFRDIELPHIDIHPTRGRFLNDQDNSLVNGTNALDNLSLINGSLSDLPLDDAISRCLRTQLEPIIDLVHVPKTATMMLNLFSRFSVELDQISHLYSLSIWSAKPLSEEEILIGTIIGKSTQHRVRQNKISSMREATSLLVEMTLKELKGGEDALVKDFANRAWMAWKVSILKRDTFGAKCFGFVSIRALCDVLDILDTGTDAGDIQ